MRGDGQVVDRIVWTSEVEIDEGGGSSFAKVRLIALPRRPPVPPEIGCLQARPWLPLEPRRLYFCGPVMDAIGGDTFPWRSTKVTDASVDGADQRVRVHT